MLRVVFLCRSAAEASDDTRGPRQGGWSTDGAVAAEGGRDETDEGRGPSEGQHAADRHPELHDTLALQCHQLTCLHDVLTLHCPKLVHLMTYLAFTATK